MKMGTLLIRCIPMWAGFGLAVHFSPEHAGRALIAELVGGIVSIAWLWPTRRTVADKEK